MKRNMKITIDEVYKGTHYQNVTYDYSVHGRTSNGSKLVLFDPKFDLRIYKNYTLDCLLNAFMVQNINCVDEKKPFNRLHPILEGIYIKSYQVPEKWKKCEGSYKSIFLKNQYAVKLEYGVMLMEFARDGDEEKINDGDTIKFTVGRIDLLAWLPVE